MDAQADEPTIEEILAQAAQAGLPLTEAEAGQLRAGVRRLRSMAAEVRAIAGAGAEPGDAQVEPWFLDAQDLPENQLADQP